MRFLRGCGLDNDVVEAPIIAIMGKPALGGPGLTDYGHRLFEARGCLFHRDAETIEFDMAIPLADPEIEPAF